MHLPAERGKAAPSRTLLGCCERVAPALIQRYLGCWERTMLPPAHRVRPPRPRGPGLLRLAARPGAPRGHAPVLAPHLVPPGAPRQELREERRHGALQATEQFARCRRRTRQMESISRCPLLSPEPPARAPQQAKRPAAKLATGPASCRGSATLNIGSATLYGPLNRNEIAQKLMRETGRWLRSV